MVLVAIALNLAQRGWFLSTFGEKEVGGRKGRKEEGEKVVGGGGSKGGGTERVGRGASRYMEYC